MELNTQNFQSYEDNREVPEQLRILILEDNPADAELMQFELQEAGFDFRSELVDNKQSFLQALKKFSPDIILSDYDLPTYSGWEALQIRNNLYPDTPFILVTGALVEERAIEVLTNGATDYVLKHNLTKLSPAVHRALNEVYEHRKRKEAEEERDRAEEALKQREYLYRTLFNNTEDGLVLIEPIFTEMGNSDDYRILEVNDACERQTGLRAADLLGKRVREIMPKVEPIWTATFGEVAKSGVAKHIERYNTGSGRWFDVHALPYQRGQVVLLFRDITDRKRTEEALRESQEKYRSVVENTSAIILRIDPSGVMTFANKRALEFFGYTTEEMIGKHVVGTIVPPQETTGRDLAAMVDEIINNPAHFYSNANENICKDGRRVWIEWTNSGVYNNDGSLKEFLSVGIDATESKKAFQTQEYLRALMDHSPSLAFLKDEFGRYVYVNKSYIDQFNLPQDWIGKTDFDFWPKETAELFRKNDVDVLRSGQTQQFLEDSFDLNGNRHCWLCYKFMFTDSNGRPYVGGIGIDNVDRIRAEEALAKSEKKYRTLFEMIDEGFCVIEVLYDEADCSSDWRFLEVNPAFEIQTGINNAIGRRMREIAPDLEEHWFKIFGNVALSGQPIRCENPALAIGHYYEVYAFRVGKPEQRRVGILFNDIRKRKQAENEREDLIARLQMVNKELESFTYSVSHDLRAPLRAIDSLSRMLIMDLEEKRDTEAKRRLHFIRDNTIKMNSLIDNLLALSRITRTEMSCIKVDMKALAESAWKAALDANPETKASISIGDLPEAMGNQNLLFQVFTNLLSNAAKYTKKRRKALIEVGGEIKGQENVYYVKDNGAGFNMKYYDKLFGVFQRLHPESEYEGTGVGLAIVQRIIHRHGGRVWAKGKVGKGATFYFTLRNQA